MGTDQILKRLFDSEVNRLVEVVFLSDILNFSATTHYPAAIRYIDDGEFYLLLSAAEEMEQTPPNDAFQGIQLRVLPLDFCCTVVSSTYHSGLGHLLLFSNNIKLHQRRFLRIPFGKKILVSIIREGALSAKGMEVYTLDLSATGMALRCRRGCGLTYGTECQLKILDPNFPGYDPDQAAALLRGKVVRTFPNANQPDCENVGIQFIYNHISEEYAKTDLLDEFCWRMAFPRSQNSSRFQQAMRLTPSINASRDIETVLFKMNRSVVGLVSSEASSILLFDEADPYKSYLVFKAVSGEKSQILDGVRVSDGVAWWVAQTGEPAVINDVASDQRFVGTVDRMTNFQTKSTIAVPVIWEQEVIGVLEAVNKTNAVGFTQFDLQLLNTMAGHVASVIKNGQMREKYENFFTNTIELTVSAIESVGGLMGLMSPGHCWRVAGLATAMGSHFGITGQAFDDLYYGAALHDIGYLEAKHHAPLRLASVGNITHHSMHRVVKLHPVAGEHRVKAIQMWRGAAPIIRHHHEHFDGSGSPDGLKGAQIPLEAQIVAVLEAYEESIHWLSYQDWNDSELYKRAIEMIQKASGTQFNPQVVDAFINQLEQFCVGE